mmetsp:Transcript_55665/g.180668  ORF Transcript_55665/g.180668 Transcript_55665/m.180668 type:complete len:265 (+) Transcript_55665:299-1093(+)
MPPPRALARASSLSQAPFARMLRRSHCEPQAGSADCSCRGPMEERSWLRVGAAAGAQWSSSASISSGPPASRTLRRTSAAAGACASPPQASSSQTSKPRAARCLLPCGRKPGTPASRSANRLDASLSALPGRAWTLVAEAPGSSEATRGRISSLAGLCTPHRASDRAELPSRPRCAFGGSGGADGGSSCRAAGGAVGSPAEAFAPPLPLPPEGCPAGGEQRSTEKCTVTATDELPSFLTSKLRVTGDPPSDCTTCKALGETSKA